MSGYNEHFAEVRQSLWLERWVPIKEADDKGFTERERFFLAKARDAEATLKEFRAAMAALRRALAL